MIDTPYGETSTMHDLMAVAIDKHVPMGTAIVIRVIEREALIHIADGEPQDLDRLTVLANSETRTFILDPEDIEYIDGMVYLVVGEQHQD